VSPVQLEQRDFAHELLKILEEASFPPTRLEVEITEAALVTDREAARAIVDVLQANGVRVALDNFGTGHSSLLQLRQLTFDKLKIDRSFVRAMSTDKEAAVMVRTIISMAKSLGLVVVAEGVEFEDQARALAGLGCDMAQGYYFGRAAAGADSQKTARSKAQDSVAAPGLADATS
jgi:EAL domain-containing protein (putative c-di-GMP-specific phosphodiesterase class I)